MININITTLIQIFNFLVVYFLLKKLFFNPLLEVMDQRKAKLNSLSLGFAEENAELEKLETQYNQELTTYLVEASKIRGKSKAEAEQKVLEEVLEVQKDNSRKWQESKKEIDNEIERLSSFLEKESNDFVARIIGKLC